MGEVGEPQENQIYLKRVRRIRSEGRTRSEREEKLIKYEEEHFGKSVSSILAQVRRYVEAEDDDERLGALLELKRRGIKTYYGYSSLDDLKRTGGTFPDLSETPRDTRSYKGRGLRGQPAPERETTAELPVTDDERWRRLATNQD